MTALSDNFNRANGTGLGANWTAWNSTVKILSNQVTDNGSSTAAFMRYSATQLATPDQFVQHQVSTIAGDGTIYLFARLNAATTIATATGYGAYVAGAAGAMTCGIWYYSAGTLNWLVVGLALPGAMAANDTMRFEVTGNSQSLIYNGVQRAATSDSHVPTGGYTGLGVSTNAALVNIDNWAAGDLNRSGMMALL